MKYLFFILVTLFLVSACSTGFRPTDLGVKSGRLVSCPHKPNCVVSNEDEDKHYIAPIPYTVDQETAFKVLREIISDMKRTEIIEETPIYLRLECKTKTFGFIDDVEFYFPNEPVILIRSAARVGYWDFGLNRKRLENVRRQFEEKIKAIETDKAGDE